MVLEVTKKKIENGIGVVWIESSNMEEVVSPAARKLAYAQRAEMGLHEAGLDMVQVDALDNSGEVIEDGDATVTPVKYRRIFTLTAPPI